MSNDNVRIKKTRKSVTARDLAHDDPAQDTAPRPKMRKARIINRTPEELDRHIEHLECFISAAGATARHQHLLNADQVPPAEELKSKVKPKRRPTSERPMQVRYLERRRSAALFTQIIILFLVIAATVGWMNQRFHFWN